VSLQKQPVNFNFSQGVDTKSDPFQVQIGKFLSLENSIFQKGGLLQKSNGFGSLPALPDATSTFVTTFNGDLTALGVDLKSYSPGSMSWVTKGRLQPLSLNVLPLIRNNLNQIQSDAAISYTGFVCTVYTETDGVNNFYRYALADSVTGQNIIPPTLLPGADPTYGTPRVFLSGNYFIIVYTRLISAAHHLSFIAISINSSLVVTAPSDVVTAYDPSTTLAWDGAVLGDVLYLAWNGASGAGIRMASIATNLAVSGSVLRDAAHTATLMSVAADIQNNIIWATYYDLGTTNGYTLAVTPQLGLLPSFPMAVITGITVNNLATVAASGIMTLFYEVSNTASGVQTNFINQLTVTQSTAVVSATTVLKRSVGLASKSFFIGSTIYVLTEYASAYQSTYFLIDSLGDIAAKVAYSNGGGYLTLGLPSVSVTNNVASISYLFKDLIQSVNKNTNIPPGNQVAGVYAQTGINLVNLTIGTSSITTAEIGVNLNISGGFLWAYDGYLPVENGFFLYPDSIQATWSASGGSIAAQPDGATNTNAYWYQVTYEWADNQGNLFRSAPSIPVAVTTTGAGSSGSITLVVPTLRLTYKIANPVKIVIYRWSVNQQDYYQTTSIFIPLLNDPTIDFVTYVDVNSDSFILGNNQIYTFGGIVENINGPASANLTLFDDRLWQIDAEDDNLLWFSKEVIESTPVEMSDLLTMYIAPTIGAQGSTGGLSAFAPMDDKLILFKKSGAILYVNGTGPDSTGANNQYSQPIFITGSVGCANQNSIVMSPQGLIFQSDKGLWLLTRSLQTEYVGSPVEFYNSTIETGAVGIPGTNQDRFTNPEGTLLMWDYFYQQWGTFTNVPAVSSTLYQGLHTYISPLGQVFQETPGVYLNGSSPVLMAFKTGWLNLAGLQGYQKAYYFLLLGTYLSPHKLVIDIAYNYSPFSSQQVIIQPNNFSPTYGQDLAYGSGNPYGGPPSLEEWKIFFKQKRCESFQISIQEIYDPSYGVVAGPGLTLSGINVVVGIKKGWRPSRASQNVGG
jgi:hypothetical protein